MFIVFVYHSLLLYFEHNKKLHDEESWFIREMLVLAREIRLTYTLSNANRTVLRYSNILAFVIKINKPICRFQNFTSLWLLFTKTWMDNIYLERAVPFSSYLLTTPLSQFLYLDSNITVKTCSLCKTKRNVFCVVISIKTQCVTECLYLIYWKWEHHNISSLLLLLTVSNVWRRCAIILNNNKNGWATHWYFFTFY